MFQKTVGFKAKKAAPCFSGQLPDLDLKRILVFGLRGTFAGFYFCLFVVYLNLGAAWFFIHRLHFSLVHIFMFRILTVLLAMAGMVMGHCSHHIHLVTV